MLNNLLAQGETINITPGGGGTSADLAPLTNITVGGIISGAITLVLIVAGVIFFFMLIIGGLRWILSGGDKAQTESARSQITAALVGLVIVFAAFAIATLVQSLFGINIMNFTLPTFTTTPQG
jgi:hypothetical protein